MSGFAGFAGFDESLWEERYLWGSLGKRCAKRLTHRGPDEHGTHVSENCVLAHVRLALSDPLFGNQPMTETLGDCRCTIVYDGHLSGAPSLRSQLQGRGFSFKTNSEAEVVLKAYMAFGDEVPALLEGAFAFAIDDRRAQRLFLCRDRLGEKPLFYTFSGDRIVFGSEIKALFEYPGIKATLDRQGLCELFGMGPARSPGSGVFKNIHQLPPGHSAVYDRKGFARRRYYSLMSNPCVDSCTEAAERVRQMLAEGSAARLTGSQTPAALLTGSVDSAAACAFTAEALKDSAGLPDSFSISFSSQEEDAHWAQLAAAHIGTEHSALSGSAKTLFTGLYDSVIARDLPGLSNSDSRLIYLCRQVKNRHSLALCGACADTVFGLYDGRWNPSDQTGIRLLDPQLSAGGSIESYVNNCYQDILWNTPLVSGESDQARQHRQDRYLALCRQLPLQLEQLDRMSMYNGLRLYTPYADHRLVEYLFNLPADCQNQKGVRASLLRDAAASLLPDDILYRKTHLDLTAFTSEYLGLLNHKLKFILSDTLQPIHKLLDRKKMRDCMRSISDYGKPLWDDQPVTPALAGYLIQLNYWMLRYNVYLAL